MGDKTSFVGPFIYVLVTAQHKKETHRAERNKPFAIANLVQPDFFLFFQLTDYMRLPFCSYACAYTSPLYMSVMHTK